MICYFFLFAACDGLPVDSMNLPPNPFVVVSTILPPQQTWVQHSHTEIVEVSLLCVCVCVTKIVLVQRFALSYYHHISAAWVPVVQSLSM